MKYAIYGANRVAKDFLYIFDTIEVVCILENQCDIDNFCGIKVLTFDTNTIDYDMIIVCDFDKTDKIKYLESKGLVYGKDFLYEKDFFQQLNDIEVNKHKKPIVIWGTGNKAEIFNTLNLNIDVEFYIDDYKNVNIYNGKKVLKSKDILDLNKYFIIITVTHDKQIVQELQNKGFTEVKDYLNFSDLFLKMPSIALERTIFDASYYNIACKTMLREIELLSDGMVHCCCGTFMYCGIGTLNNNNDLDNLWNSNIHKIMCLSLQNKTFSFCRKGICPLFVNKKATVTKPDLLKAEYNEMNKHPDTANLAFDSTCNLKCITCRDELRIACGDELKRVERYSRLVQKQILPYIDFMILAGDGEVFFSKSYKDIYLNDNVSKIKWIRLLSNGMLFNEKNWNEFYANKNGKIMLTVSIDAATKETYESIRRNGNFNVLQENMKFASKLRKEGKLSYFRINFVVQKKNYLEMERFVEWGLELKVDEVFFTKILNWGTYSVDEFKEISMMQEDGVTPKPELVEILNKPIMKNDIVDLGTIQYQDSEVEKIDNYYKWELERKVPSLFSD